MYFALMQWFFDRCYGEFFPGFSFIAEATGKFFLSFASVAVDQLSLMMPWKIFSFVMEITSCVLLVCLFSSRCAEHGFGWMIYASFHTLWENVNKKVLRKLNFCVKFIMNSKLLFEISNQRVLT